MAQKKVIEVQCDRCKRVEYLDLEGPPLEEDEATTLTVVFGTTRVSFDDLCKPCRKTVKGYIEKIAKEIEQKSPERGAKSKGQSDDNPDSSAQSTETTSSSEEGASASTRQKGSARPTSGQASP
jgi:hypothetical protein